jgi:hypothetical protein
VSGFVTAVAGGIIGFFIGGPLGAIAGFGIGLGLGMMMPKIPGPKIGDAMRQTAQAGVSRPKPYGHPAPFKGNHIDGEDVARKIKGDSGGKGAPSAPEPDRYLLTYAIRVCEGPISGFVRIWRNEVVVLDNRDPATLPAGWEGYSKKVKVAQSDFLKRARLYLGTEDQLPDPALEALDHNGVGNTPYHRGSAYIVLEDEDVSDMQGAIADYKFEVTTAATVTIADSGVTLIGHWPLDDGVTSNTGETHVGLARDLSSYDWDGTYVNELTPGAPLDNHTASSMGVGVGGGAYIPDDGHLHFSESSPWKWTVALSINVTDTTMHGPGVIGIAGYWGSVQFGYAKWAFMLRSVDGTLETSCIRAGFTKPGEVFSYVEGPVGLTTGRMMIVSRGSGLPLELWINGRLVAVEPTLGGQTWSDGTDGIRVFAASTYYAATTCLGKANNLKYWSGAASPDFIRQDAAYYGHMAGTVSMPDGDGYYVDPITGEVLGGGEQESLTDGSVYLKDVEQSIMQRCNVPLDAIDLSAIDGIIIPGFLVAERASGADVLSPLLQGFLHDLPEVDGAITAVVRGGATALALQETDFVRKPGDSPEYDTTPQNMEFPLKLSVITQSPEGDYAPLPQTSLRFTPDVVAADEISIPLAVPLSVDATAQLAHKLHNVAWARAEAKLERTLPEKYSTLVVSDTFYYRNRRWIVQEIKYDRSFVDVKCDYDPIYAYDSDATGTQPPIPPPPTGNVMGPTLAMVMNLPPLLEEHTIGVYVAIKGLMDGWDGADFYLSTDDEATYVNVGDWTKPSWMGQLTLDEAGEPLVVTPFSGDGPLSACTADQAATGRNWFVAQRADTDECELMSFTTPTENVDGDWELTGLAHSIKGTPHSDHLAGDGFTLVDNLFFLAIPREFAGQTLYLRPVTKGTVVDANESIAFVFAPVDAMLDPGPHRRIDGNGDARIDANGDYRETA